MDPGGGTSLSAPLIAGMIGLAGNASQLDDPSYLYAHQSGLQDVVGGANGFCGGDYLCTAKKGYDAPRASEARAGSPASNRRRDSGSALTPTPRPAIVCIH